MPSLADLYSHLPDESLRKVQAPVAILDLHIIRSVAPDVGIHTHIIQSTFKGIADELRTHGINHYTPENRLALLAIISRRTSPRPVSTVSDSDGRSTVEGLRGKVENPKSKPADDASKREDRGRGKGAKSQSR